MEKVKCPKCGYLCAVKNGKMITCLSHDHLKPCNFKGTVKDAENLKKEISIEKRTA